MQLCKRAASLICALLILCTGFLPVSAAYENTYKNTGNHIQDIIGVAKTQIGYKEGALSGTVSGSNDCTKYGQWYGMNYVPWCAIFVSWCADQAGISTSIIPRHSSCDSGVEWFKAKGEWHDSEYYGGNYTPKPGDIVYFGTRSSKYFDSTHVGIIYKVTDTSVFDIEGNSGASVASVSYKRNSAYVLGYASPDYQGAPEQYHPGEYIVNASVLNVRSKPTTSSDIVTTLNEGTHIKITEFSGGWGKTVAGGKTGWVSMAYCSALITVTFDANGGSAAPAKMIKSANIGISIPLAVPTRSGYRFAGWATTPGACYPEYVIGQRIVSDISITLYAIWEPITTKVVVLSDGNGKTLVSEYKGETRVCVYAENENAISYLAVDGAQQILLGDTQMMSVSFDDNKTHRVDVSFDPNAILWVNPFNDVPADSWFNKAVGFCYINRFFSGVTANTFSPGTNMTRENAVVVLGKVYEFKTGKTIPTANNTKFKDVKSGSYYEKYVVWASKNSITGGITSNTFGVGSNITRAQIALMLKSLAALTGEDVSYDMTRLDGITDAFSAGDWATGALSWGIGKGIISASNSQILPKSNATRAQIAQMLYKLYY